MDFNNFHIDADEFDAMLCKLLADYECLQDIQRSERRQRRLRRKSLKQGEKSKEKEELEWELETSDLDGSVCLYLEKKFQVVHREVQQQEFMAEWLQYHMGMDFPIDRHKPIDIQTIISRFRYDGTKKALVFQKFKNIPEKYYEFLTDNGFAVITIDECEMDTSLKTLEEKIIDKRGAETVFLKGGPILANAVDNSFKMKLHLMGKVNASKNITNTKIHEEAQIQYRKQFRKIIKLFQKGIRKQKDLSIRLRLSQSTIHRIKDSFPDEWDEELKKSKGVDTDQVLFKEMVKSLHKGRGSRRVLAADLMVSEAKIQSVWTKFRTEWEAEKIKLQKRDDEIFQQMVALLEAEGLRSYKFFKDKLGLSEQKVRTILNENKKQWEAVLAQNKEQEEVYQKELFNRMLDCRRKGVKDFAKELAVTDGEIDECLKKFHKEWKDEILKIK